MLQQQRQRNNTARVLTRGFLLFFFLTSASIAHAVQDRGSIDTTNKYAFSNVGGWMNFNPSNAGLTITDSLVTGYAWSANDGWINFSPTNGGVKNDTQGHLSGFAWDQTAGWVNFAGVSIDAKGRFHGQAVGGTVNGASYAITFDCANCNVTTDWLPASARVYPGAISPVYVPPVPSPTPTTVNTPPATEPPAGQLPPTQTAPTRGAGGTPPNSATYRTGNVISTTPLATSTKPIKKPVVASTTKSVVSVPSFWHAALPVVGGVSLVALLGLLWWVFFL